MHAAKYLVRFALAKQETLLQIRCCHVLDKHALHISQASFYVRFGFLVTLRHFGQDACYNPAADRSGQCLGLPGAITAMSFSQASTKSAKGCAFLLPICYYPFLQAASFAYNYAQGGQSNLQV